MELTKLHFYVHINIIYKGKQKKRKKEKIKGTGCSTQFCWSLLTSPGNSGQLNPVLTLGVENVLSLV